MKRIASSSINDHPCSRWIHLLWLPAIVCLGCSGSQPGTDGGPVGDLTGSEQSADSFQFTGQDHPACNAEGWCWAYPLPFGGTLRAVHGSSADEVWAAGDYGFVFRWGREGWSCVKPPTNAELRAVWVSSISDLWVAGAEGALLHWTGGSWDSTQSLAPDSALFDIWGTDPNNLWAVGSDAQGGVVLHFDGQTWTKAQTPQVTGLRAVHGSSATDVWAVGGAWDSAQVIHFDGQGWKEVPSPELTISKMEGRLADVWVSPSRRVWTVAPGVNFSAILRWDGSQWTKSYHHPEPGVTGLWGSSDKDIWAVSSSKSPLLHFDGNKWQPVGSKQGRLMAIGAAGRDLWSVGAQSLTLRGQPGKTWEKLAGTADNVEFRHLSGEKGAGPWFSNGQQLLQPTSSGLQPLKKPFQFHSSIYASNDHVWTLGLDNRLPWYFDGTVWHQLATDGLYNSQIGYGGGYSKIFAAGKHVWASDNPYIKHFDGNTWSSLECARPWSPGNPAHLYSNTISLWGSSATDVWFFDENSVAHQTDKGCECINEQHSINDLHGSASSCIWGVGHDSLVLRYDGQSWKEVSFPFRTDLALLSVWVVSCNDVWILGYPWVGQEETKLYHWDGTQWSSEPIIPYSLAVWASPDQVYLGTQVGVLVKQRP